MNCGYRVFEHTADVGLTIWAETLASLFACAANGLVRVALSRSGGRAPEGGASSRLAEVNIPPAPDVESLLVDWLNSVVFLMDTEGYYPYAYDIDVFRRDEASFAVAGRITTRPVADGLRVAVKGATYHGLKVTRSKEGQFRARVILDV